MKAGNVAKLLILTAGSLLVLAGCGDASVKSALPSKIETGFPNLIESAPTLVGILPATGEECGAGGSVFFTYVDHNRNQIFDEADVELSRAKVCHGLNGQNGSQGAGAGILVESAAAHSCSAGGMMITTFVDANNSSILDPLETVTSVSTICNGRNGADGVNGADGAAAALTVSLASASQCAEGGVVYSSASGGQTSPDVTVICNGSNGRDGEDVSYSMGAVGASVSGHQYSACHHDYLYLPDDDGSDRGWLMFRHQGNGSFDQGIGQTGFQVWNVDLERFSLVSEVGNRRYCDLTWNAASRELHYVVVDSSDGLQGQSGTIQL